MKTTDDRIASAGSHPTLEELAAYFEKRLPEPEAGRIRSHLIECGDCAEVVLDLSEASDLEPDAASAATSEVEESWTRLRAAIAKKRQRTSARKVEARVAAGWKPFALAASLSLVVSGGINGWLWLQSEDRIPPQVDPPWVTLAPTGALRSGGREVVPVLELAPGVRGWISFAFSAPEAVTMLRVRFFAGSGTTVVWSWSGSRPDDSRILRMELTTREVPPDEYRIELDGRVNATRDWKPLAEYHLRVAR